MDIWTMVYPYAIPWTSRRMIKHCLAVRPGYPFKIIYHPSSGKKPRFFTDAEYLYGRFNESTCVGVQDPTPWHPIRCKYDFKIIEFVISNYTSTPQTKILLDLLHDSPIDGGTSKLTLRDFRDLEHSLEEACKLRTKVFSDQRYPFSWLTPLIVPTHHAP